MGFPTTRRGFVALLLALAAPRVRDALAGEPVIGRATPAAAMRALVDTLLPADEQPSGSSLGADVALLRAGAADAGLGDLIIQGTDWLDARARERGGADFSALDEATREALIAAAEQASVDSVQHRFFTAIRHLAFRHYYAQAMAWEGLGYAGPPQPLGFPDHAHPPEAERL